MVCVLFCAACKHEPCAEHTQESDCNGKTNENKQTCIWNGTDCVTVDSISGNHQKRVQEAPADQNN
ncbi:MAG: hypothetical protein AAF310_05210 [Myxococcota bacterium]